MTTTRAVVNALLAGAVFTAIIATVDYFSSGLRLNHVVLGGLIFTVLFYFGQSRQATRIRRSQDIKSSPDRTTSDDDSNSGS